MDSDFMFLTIQLHLDRCIIHCMPMGRALARLLLPGEVVHDMNDRNVKMWAQEQGETEKEDE